MAESTHEATYVVSGMSCEHCVRSVTEEVSELDGVEDVAVDLSSGQVTVSSTDALNRDTVRGAVEEAGYQLVS